MPTKVRLVKAMIFPVAMYGCESWIIKKAEHWRIDAFELWCWRRLLRGPWTIRRSDQSILKEISPEYSLEGLMLKLKLHNSGYLMQRTDSLEKTLMLGKIEGMRRRGWQRKRWLDGHHRLNGHEFEQAPGVGDGQVSLACCSPWGHKESDTNEQLSWTELMDGGGNPLQCSCLENPRDGGAWLAAVYRVAQSRTRLKWLSSSSSSNGTDKQRLLQLLLQLKRIE